MIQDRLGVIALRGDFVLKNGKEFEKAVYEFISKLGPNTKAYFDHEVPDRITGEPRQCDVWISSNIGGIFPVSIYVSCKDHKRKLHLGDIDAFLGEMRERNATTGVIYSKSGYTKTAIEKARMGGISCCRLYEDETSDIPEIIFFNQYACYPSLSLELQDQNIPKDWKLWNDIFYQETDGLKVIEIIERCCIEGEKLSLENAKKDGKPPLDWENTIKITDDDNRFFLKIRLIDWWRFYKARTEATYYNGSYNYLDNQFHGSFTGPVIDTQGSEPGIDWEKIYRQEFDQSASRLITILYRGKITDQIIKVYGDRLLSKRIQKVYDN